MMAYKYSIPMDCEMNLRSSGGSPVALWVMGEIWF